MAKLPMPPALRDLIGSYDLHRRDGGESGCEVFRLDMPNGEALYLKHGTGRSAADVVDEMVRLRWLAGRLPVPAVRHFTAAGDAAWLLTTAMPGLTADEWFEAAPAALPTIAAEAAAFLRRLHDLPVDDCPFDARHRIRMAAARRNIDAGLVDEDDFDDDNAGLSAVQVWDDLCALLPFARDPVVTHGDYSMGNLLFDGGHIAGCIDVGRLGVADRYQDLAIFWQNLGEFAPDLQEPFLRIYGLDAIDPQRLRFHRLLDELF